MLRAAEGVLRTENTIPEPGLPDAGYSGPTCSRLGVVCLLRFASGLRSWRVILTVI